MVSMADAVPHTRAMLLVDIIETFDPSDASISVSLIVDPFRHYWDAQRQRFRPLWLIELVSQASAALYFLLCRAKGEPVQIGFLISIKEFAYASSRPIRPGDSLKIRSQLSVDFHPFGVFDSHVYLGDEEIAHSSMNLVIKKGDTP